MNNKCDILTSSDKNGKLTFGKNMLTSHRNYNLWNEHNNTFNIENINYLYSLYVYNMSISTKIFKTRWVRPNKLIATSKKLIWDWTNDEEKLITAQDIFENGMYFPIFTLDKGKLHNQIMNEKELAKLSEKELYNSYNGNHRIDVIHHLQKCGKWKNKEVLIYIIPEFCEKSCTGFKYSLIDDSDNGNRLAQYKLPFPLYMYHLNNVEHEMKVINWRNKTNISSGISKVLVDNYNVAFRIVTEFQNVLEQPLVNYYKTFKTLPDIVKNKSKGFNDKDIFEKEILWI